jgi:hypothetical protein
MNAQIYFVTDVGNGIGCPGQVDLKRAAATTTKASTKASGLRGARAIRHWFDNAQPSRAPQVYAGLAG